MSLIAPHGEPWPQRMDTTIFLRCSPVSVDARSRFGENVDDGNADHGEPSRETGLAVESAARFAWAEPPA